MPSAAIIRRTSALSDCSVTASQIPGSSVRNTATAERKSRRCSLWRSSTSSSRNSATDVFVTEKRCEQVSGFGTVVDGECSQADTGDPPLGASLQRTGQFGCRVDRYGGEQFPRIVEPECEISLPDFGNTALCALAAERNRRIAAADDNRVNRGRKIGEEPTRGVASHPTTEDGHRRESPPSSASRGLPPAAPRPAG